MGTRIAGKQWVAKRQPYTLGGGAAPVIAFRNSRVQSSSANATSITVTPPLATAVGDLMLMVLATDAGSSVHSTPAGWTALPVSGLNQVDTSGAHVFSGWWKVATAADAAQTTFSLSWTTLNTYAHVIAGWSGVSTTTPLDVNNTSINNGSFTASPSSANYASITTVTSNAWVVVLGTSGSGTGTLDPTVSTSSGMTIRAQAHGANVFVSAFCGDVAQPAAGASGTKSWTLTAAADTFLQGGYTVALRPGP